MTCIDCGKPAAQAARCGPCDDRYWSMVDEALENDPDFLVEEEEATT